MAVRNILACRIAQKDRSFSEISISSKAKFEAILKFIDKALDEVINKLKIFFLLFS